jgi:hypothetical protein
MESLESSCVRPRQAFYPAELRPRRMNDVLPLVSCCSFALPSVPSYSVQRQGSNPVEPNLIRTCQRTFYRTCMLGEAM